MPSKKQNDDKQLKEMLKHLKEYKKNMKLAHKELKNLLKQAGKAKSSIDTDKVRNKLKTLFS